MEENQQVLTNGTDADETLVTPRFDEVEAGTAQPVVPLAVVAAEDPQAAASIVTPFDVAPRAYRRRQWPLALVLISALAGSVLGGAGLYLYQQRQRTTPAPAQEEQPQEGNSTTTQEPPAHASSPEVSAAPVELPQAAVNEKPPAQVSALPHASVPELVRDKDDDDDDAGKREKRDKDEEKARKDEEERRRDFEKDEREGPPKRGKKGERDDERGGDDDGRRVDIVSRTVRGDEQPVRRRAERRARRVGEITVSRPPSVDRVRGIFEGQP